MEGREGLLVLHVYVLGCRISRLLFGGSKVYMVV